MARAYLALPVLPSSRLSVATVAFSLFLMRFRQLTIWQNRLGPFLPIMIAIAVLAVLHA